MCTCSQQDSLARSLAPSSVLAEFMLHARIQTNTHTDTHTTQTHNTQTHTTQTHKSTPTSHIIGLLNQPVLALFS